MSGGLGIWLQGTHPDLTETTQHDSNLAKVRLEAHPEFMPSLPIPVDEEP